MQDSAVHLCATFIQSLNLIKQEPAEKRQVSVSFFQDSCDLNIYSPCHQNKYSMRKIQQTLSWEVMACDINDKCVNFELNEMEEIKLC